MGPPVIAIIDDDSDVVDALMMLIPALTGYPTVGFTNGSEFLASLAEAPPEAIVLDLRMPPPDGREILRELTRRGHGNIPVIVVSASGRTAIDEAVAGGAVAGFQKPLELDAFVATLRGALDLKG